MQLVALQQVVDPGEFRMRLVEELAGFETHHFEAGIGEQVLHFERHVLAVVPRLGLLAFLARADVGGEERWMVALQNRADRAQGSEVGRGQDEMAAGFEDAVDFGHHVHRIGGQMLDQFTAEDGIERGVRVGKDIALGIEVIDVAGEGFAALRRRSTCGPRVRVCRSSIRERVP